MFIFFWQNPILGPLTFILFFIESPSFNFILNRPLSLILHSIKDTLNISLKLKTELLTQWTPNQFFNKCKATSSPLGKSKLAKLLKEAYENVDVLLGKLVNER